MLTIRFLRTGKKNQPFYRMVVTDKKNPPRGGRFLEIVGFLNPFTKEKQIKADRIKHWISKGAKPSDTVHNILVQEKIIEGEKVAVHGKPKKKAVAAVAQAKASQEEAKAKVAASAEASASQGKAEKIEETPAEEQPTKKAPIPETEVEAIPKAEKQAETEKPE